MANLTLDMSPSVYAIGGKKEFNTAAFYQDLCGSFGPERKPFYGKCEIRHAGFF
jgi:hypothetical protein